MSGAAFSFWGLDFSVFPYYTGIRPVFSIAGTNRGRSMDNREYIMITGASHGIGKAAAFAFAQHGHRVLAVSRNLELRISTGTKNIFRKNGERNA